MAKILIVDDDPQVQILIKSLVEMKGHESVPAETGAKALELIRQNAFDLIITDLRMPQMNGLELLREVKSLQPSLPVIMVTAYASSETTAESARLGVFEYLEKPFKIDTLLAAIERALSAGKDASRAADMCSGKNPTTQACRARETATCEK